ncbi:hypothetical protein F5B20DRAFT_571625 [Whalleya microplaca]|nr:hypothetical protein F5B20DRAFT_571625 [Whalleya microplaca]
MFKKLPSLIARQDGNEWKVPSVGLKDDLVLDTHFLGMTPLNDVQREQRHEFDHPFGSWQPKGEDKSFMWIRDELPRAMPNMRTIVYGYDTTLQQSNSFQSIRDLALSFIDHTKACGWYKTSVKRLVFLAHSLGGIVLKEAFAALANGGDKSIRILDNFIGGIFFGVPSLGMATSHLSIMVKGQHNEQMIQDLSRNSEYLQDLGDRFSGLAAVRGMRLYWAYETRTSPTVIERDGYFDRTGPEEILVSKDSATRRLHGSQDSAIFPINESHSQMVKFRRSDPNLKIVLHLIDSLYDPALDHRVQTIEHHFERTFEWAFDRTRTDLSRWLREGTGTFWIHGKPGSGKSTLMKFIYGDPRTLELLRWHRLSPSISVFASFFFHNRGSWIQKSFEGLLRSVLLQIIEKAGEELAELLGPILESCRQLRRSRADPWTIHELEKCLGLLLQQNYLDLDIFLLLDAVDEYDGQPDFICNFLKELTGITTPTRTKLKILFSSRPWDTFKQQFSNGFSIQLHDYTRDDIQKYCLGTIYSEEEDISTSLAVLAPEIMHRADGVFLWVKLVMRDLIDRAREGKRPEELASTLDSIPSDLQEYYKMIIHRIPENVRWKACSTYPECTNATRKLQNDLGIGSLHVLRYHLTKHFRSKELSLRKTRFRTLLRAMDQTKNRQFRESNRSELLTSTGNLTDTIQFIHQTVKEFVGNLDFKQSLLGHISRIKEENRHSFLSKYYLINYPWYYSTAELHERTTGRSQKEFIDSFFKVRSISPTEHHLGYQKRYNGGVLQFAICHNLRLYLEETLRHDPDVFKRTQKKLLFFRADSDAGCDIPPLNGQILRYVCNNGYTMDKDPKAFSKILKSFPPAIRPDKADIEAIAAVLVDCGQDPNVRIYGHHLVNACTALHVAFTIKLIACLLKNGADVNAGDGEGMTPLDWVVLQLIMMYQKANALAEKGGITMRSRKPDWEFFIRRCEEAGLDIATLQKCYSSIQFKENGDGMGKDTVTTYGKIRRILGT